jgi:hypothetical protein
MPQKKNPVSESGYVICNQPGLDLTSGLAGDHSRQIGQGVWTNVRGDDDFEESTPDLQQGYGGRQGAHV